MRDLDLAYLAVLVSRDGDRDLGSFYAVDRGRLYHELRSMARASNDRTYGPELRLPIMQVLSVFATHHSLDYIPWRNEVAPVWDKPAPTPSFDRGGLDVGPERG